MAVENTTPSSGAGNHAGPPQRKGKKLNKRQRMYAIAGAAGIGILALSHKGKGGGGSSSGNSEVAPNTSRIVPEAAPPIIGGGGGEGGGDGGGEIGRVPGNTDPGVTAPSNNGTEPGNSDSGAAIAALQQTADATVANAAATEEIADATQEDVKQDAGTTDRGASKRKKGTPKKHHAKKTTAATHHTGVSVDGRHFPGATSHKTTQVKRDRNGTHTTHHVGYGGKTDVHVSHNGGKSWTDHPAGHTPPSRTAHAQSHPASHSHGAESRRHGGEARPNPKAVAASAPPPRSAPAPKPVEHKEPARREEHKEPAKKRRR